MTFLAAGNRSLTRTDITGRDLGPHREDCVTGPAHFVCGCIPRHHRAPARRIALRNGSCSFRASGFVGVAFPARHCRMTGAVLPGFARRDDGINRIRRFCFRASPRRRDSGFCACADTVLSSADDTVNGGGHRAGASTIGDRVRGGAMALHALRADEVNVYWLCVFQRGGIWYKNQTGSDISCVAASLSRL